MSGERSYNQSANQMDLIDATISGRYRIEQVLGMGGAGKVCLAQDLVLGRQVALKFVHAYTSHVDPAAVQRLQREALILSQLEHPNIVQVYSIGLTDDQEVYLCMEFVPGQSLEDRLDGGSLPLKDCLAVAEQLCLAMICAQEHRVVHRDIKPANVLLTKTESGALQVKLADFGLSKVREAATGAAEGITRTNAVVGTLQYMSPEQCVGRQADSRSDIYSFGCTLFETVFGLPPFASQSPADLMRMHISQPLPKVLTDPKASGCPIELKRILARCLSKQPDQRYASFEELLADLSELKAKPGLADSGPLSLDDVEEPAAGRWWTRKVILLPAILLALAAGGLTYLCAFDGRPVMAVSDCIDAGGRPAFVAQWVATVGRVFGEDKAAGLSLSTLESPQFLMWTPDQQADLSERLLKHLLGKKLPTQSAPARFAVALKLLGAALDKMDATIAGRQSMSDSDSRHLQEATDFLLNAHLTEDQWRVLVQPVLMHDSRINRDGQPQVRVDSNFQIFDELVAETLAHNSITSKRNGQLIMLRFLGAGQAARLRAQWPAVAHYASRALEFTENNPNPDCELMARVLLAEHAIWQGRMQDAGEQMTLCRKLSDTWELWPYTGVEMKMAERVYAKAAASPTHELDMNVFLAPPAVPVDRQSQ